MQTVNFDVETQTHYGVIQYNSVNPEALQDIFDGENLTFRDAVGKVKAELRSALSDIFSDYRYSREASRLDDAVEAAWEGIEDMFNDQYESGGEEIFSYEKDGYQITNSPSLCALYVIKSPYFTYTRGCSPCCPNAGDLDNPDGGLKTYCLGHDWFDSEEAPYPVYKIADDSQENK